MTNTDYFSTDIDINYSMPSDEYKNDSLTTTKILAMTAEYWKFLDNTEIAKINEKLRQNSELLEAEKTVRDNSEKAAKKDDAFRIVMELHHKKSLFIVMQFVASYVLDTYINFTSTQRITGRGK